MKKYIYSLFLFLTPILLYSQTTFKGMIMDKNNPKDKLGIEGASVHWLATNISAITNEKGWFEIAYKSEYKKLVVN